MNDVFMRVLSLSLSGAIVALITMVLCALGKRLSKTWRYYIWLIVLLRLVVPLAPQGNNLADLLIRQAATHSEVHQGQSVSSANATSGGALPSGETGTADGKEPHTLSPDTLPALFVDSPPNAPQGDEGAPSSVQGNSIAGTLVELWQYVWIAWIAVALLLLTRVITSYRGFMRFIRAGWRAIDEPRMLDLLDEVRGLYGVKRRLPLYLNPLAASPMLVGILRPVIVLPTCQLRPEELRHILAHELVHYKRKDILYKWLVQAVCCLHWFNPIVYWMKKDINAACELSCDEQVLARVGNAGHKEYGDTLLAVMQTSGNYGNMVASVTMSEEGKMMKKRLMSIASPHKRSKVTVMLSVAISLLLLVGAAYAGAYTGAPATEEPAASTPVDSPVPEATEQLTPGERLDNFLSDMDELKDSIGEKAQEWGDKVADKAAQWAEEWDWSDAWDWIDQWDWAAMTGSDDYMFGSYHSADRTVVHEGYYQDGYILHLKYDSSAQPEDDASVLAQPAVLLSEDMAHYGEDSAFLPILQGAVDEFVAEHSQLSLKSGVLRLMNVYGPYSESPDALLARFYQEDKLGHFVAVLNSGTTSPEQQRELLYEAADDKNIAFFSALLGEETPTEDVDALLQKAYDNRDVATFYVLLDYASTGARQSLKDQATRDGRIEFLAGIEDKPSEEAIDAMIEGMADLDSRLIAVVSEYLTEDQALRIATAAYEQDNVAAFSIVMDRLNDEDVEAFHEQAHQDGKAAFYAVTGG